MNNDNKGVVMFGGQPVDGTESNNTVASNGSTNVVDNNSGSTPITDSVIPVVPLIDKNTESNETPSVEVSPNVVVSDSNVTVGPANGAIDSSSVVNVNPTNGVEVVAPSVVVPEGAVADASVSSNDSVANLSFELPSSDTSSNASNANFVVDSNNGSNAISGVVVSQNPMNVGVTANSGDSGITNLNGSGTVISNTVSGESVNSSNALQSNDTGMKSNVVSFGKYLGHLFLFSIPVIGFIFLLIKAFDKKDENISNYAKAYLVYMILIVVIAIVITFLFVSVIGFSFPNNAAAVSSFNYS